MLKHASITRPSRKQLQPGGCLEELRTPSPLLQLQIQERHSPLLERAPPLGSPARSAGSYSFISSIKRNCAGSLPSTPVKSKSPTKVPSSRLGPSNEATSGNKSESMIKVFAQTLSQDVEYITLHVNAHTKSQQIIKSLLKKFRLKHRDPNLFYLTLERYIRKEGLKCKSTMLLGDEACPVQYQQCCSNPPYNDIKFTLQARSGTLVKIYCSDVVQESRYKCLSLSTQTTVEETVELMLHCLNLIPSSAASGAQTSCPARQSSSPSSTGSSNSSNSSSSGIESDLASQRNAFTTSLPSPPLGSLMSSDQHQQAGLSSNSRASSTTSISSASNGSTVSTSTLDQFCLLIECKDPNFRRVLEPDEYLVDVYQSLLLEAKEQQEREEHRLGLASARLSQPADQWFFIKLKRRHHISQHPSAVSFHELRQNVPLPPIPASLSKSFGPQERQRIVSTTHIEVRQRPASSLAATSGAETCKPIFIQELPGVPPPKELTEGRDLERNPLPPAMIILPPVIPPRRRNLSNASSTFLASQSRNLASSNLSSAASFRCGKRHYDPAQLEADLCRLNMADADEELQKSSLPPAAGSGHRESPLVERNSKSLAASPASSELPETSPNC